MLVCLCNELDVSRPLRHADTVPARDAECRQRFDQAHHAAFAHFQPGSVLRTKVYIRLADALVQQGGRAQGGTLVVQTRDRESHGAKVRQLEISRGQGRFLRGRAGQWQLDAQALGYGVRAIIGVTAAQPAKPQLLATLAELPQVLECQHVTGADSYVLNVVAPDLAGLEALIARISLFGETRTSIVLSSPIPRRGLRPA